MWGKRRAVISCQEIIAGIVQAVVKRADYENSRRIRVRTFGNRKLIEVGALNARYAKWISLLLKEGFVAWEDGLKMRTFVYVQPEGVLRMHGVEA
ncbi:hypothetical protein Plhal304r1_c055g0140471 [Plasmopara halstedii]